MLITFLIGFLAAVANCQHMPKIARLPNISNSLVNLGKMDISLHINTRGDTGSFDQVSRASDIFPAIPGLSSSFFDPSSVVSEPSGICSCMKNAMKDNQRSNPIDIINKILTSNNLFTNAKDPISSTLCCGNSMEQFEETVILDLTKPPMKSYPSIIPNLPLASSLDTFRPPSLPKISPKSKSFELFFYPNKKENIFKFFPKKNKPILERVHPVGEGELRKSMDRFNLRSFAPVNSSVKKDLNVQQKGMGRIEEEPAKEVKDVVEVPKTKDAGLVNDTEVTKDNKVVTDNV